ncbi:MAG: hypothetical protein JO316_22135 [Abitibacteriaceae bacterium]|nr:hypothetical protein [Abditibacteriaceae bacterium]
MRNSSSQRAYQREEMHLRMRRPPEEYVSLLSQNEQEFRGYVHALEGNPLFNKLVNDGMLTKVRLRGKIPRAKYEEFMDEQLLHFLKTYKITEQEGWERDLLAPNALNRVAELAEKYQAPVGQLLRHLRYIRMAGHSSLPNWSAAQMRETPSEDSHFTAIDDAASPDAKVDLTEIIETTREFVQRYDVSEQDFLNLILGGETTPEDLAERFGCSLREAEEVLEAADRVYLAESYETSGQAAPAKRRSSGRSDVQQSEDAVAFVQVVDEQVSIQFEHDSIYAQRYRIDPQTLREIRSDAALSAAARELLMRARFVNQRLSALSRLITTLCNQQKDYLKAGDLRHLKPLAQAELARELGEHPSTVSRLIRGKMIETPWGKIPLLFLCQSKTDVVARLISEFPKLTDQEVVSRLRDEYGCFIARRTVAYHRGKRLRRNKRRKPAPGAEGTQQAVAATPATTVGPAKRGRKPRPKVLDEQAQGS